MVLTCYLYLHMVRTAVLLQDSHVLDTVWMQNENIVSAPDSCISYIVSFTGIDFPQTMGWCTSALSTPFTT